MTAATDPPEPPEPTEPPEPAPEPPPVAMLDAVTVAKTCLAAGEPDLIPSALALPLDADTLTARIEQARALRQLCAIAKRPEAAADYISAGLTPDQVKLRLWDSIVAADRALGEIDTTPPVATKKPTTDPTVIARAALVYQQAQQEAGAPLSFAEAVAHIAKTGVPS